MKVLIIDDESRARNVLTALLTEECKDITTILQASNLKDGVSIIKKEAPELVLLDIEMPQESGLEILSYFKNEPIHFKIVFTTAYNQYAVEAFKLSAVDYLLKPIDSDELKIAVTKTKDIINDSMMQEKMILLERAFQQLSLNKIAIDFPKGIKFISHDDILYFEAEGVYTNIFLADGSKELICKTLKHFSDQLSNKPLFYKPHRSYLLNLKFMDEIVKTEGLHVIMNNKKTIPISRARKEEFLEMIQRIF